MKEVLWSQTEHINFGLLTQDSIEGFLSLYSILPLHLLELVAPSIPKVNEYEMRSEQEGKIISYFLNRDFHRLTGPAHINLVDRYEIWYYCGYRNRQGGPAFIDLQTGEERYYFLGRRHEKDEIVSNPFDQ